MTLLGVFLVNQIRTGGDRDYIELLELLAERGNKVYVIMNAFLNYKPRAITPVYLTINYKRHVPPPASFRFKYSIIKNFTFILNNISGNQPEFIHIHGDIYLKSAIYLKNKLRIPLFYASRLNDISKTETLRKFHAYSAKEYIFSLLVNRINRYREKQIAKHSDLICFLNPLDLGIFISRTKRNNKNLIVIPNNIGPPRFTEKTRQKNNSNTLSCIAYVGSLSPAKGLWDLLKAAAILKNNGFKLFYHILGRIENEKRTLTLIERLRLKDDISIEGFVDPFPFFVKCDLFVYPTLYDDFGNVVTEALHCGCPVLASNSTGPSYILKYNELLFNLGAPNEVAEKIEKCIINNNYYQKIRSLCAKTAEVFRFDWAKRKKKKMKNYLVENKTN
jgi:glycosyltransferase involved in cell wall biosynthesis